MADSGIHAKHLFAARGVYLLDDHEVVRRGLRQLLQSDDRSIAGESGSALEAVRRIPALRPKLVIIGEDLPDGSGADVCAAIALKDPGIRCVLMTSDGDETVLIDAILAGAWGCLSKGDDNREQLRLIQRALDGHTAYSGRFRPLIVAPLSPLRPQQPDEGLLTLTKRETTVAIGLGQGQSNRQISQEMFLAEKTVKNIVSAILAKLGMTNRTQAAVLITRAQKHTRDSNRSAYRSSRFPELIAEVTAALLNCISETGAVAPTEGARAANAARLAAALTMTRAG
jgi:DNA-binding NarL/FixJ family response regulator